MSHSNVVLLENKEDDVEGRRGTDVLAEVIISMSDRGVYGILFPAEHPYHTSSSYEDIIPIEALQAAYCLMYPRHDEMDLPCFPGKLARSQSTTAH